MSDDDIERVEPLVTWVTGVRIPQMKNPPARTGSSVWYRGFD